MVHVRVHPEIFRLFPAFQRGLVLATGMDNHGSSEKLERLLREVVEERGRDPIDLKTDLRLQAWSEAHRAFGSNPNKFPPAHVSLLKRLQKPGVQVPFINKVVAIMNYNSIASVMPVGGDDLNRAGDLLELRRAGGEELFAPLGTPEVSEHPTPGEVIYVTGSGEVMCRRWNWRNGHTTRITEETRDILMNIDGLGEGIEPAVVATRDKVASMLEEFCGARAVTSILSPAVSEFRV
jgi:DNA/RNA-binding domain of Phe-tRNA-synthetase-like protein